MNTHTQYSNLDKAPNILVITPHLRFSFGDFAMSLSNFVAVSYVIPYNPLFEVVKYAPGLKIFDTIRAYYVKEKLCPTDVFQRLKVHFVPVFFFKRYSTDKSLGDKMANSIRNFIKKTGLKFDLIHAHFTWPSGYVAAKLSKEFSAPLVITAHGYDVYDLPFRSEEWFRKVKFALESADHIITVSKSNFMLLVTKIGIPEHKISVIPNGFDPHKFGPINKAAVRKQLNLPQNKKIILNVASLVSEKGQSYLIEAMKEVVRSRKDLLCIIVGDGPLRKDLENQIKNLNLEDYVKLVGAKPHDEIPLWMNAADLFVLPSLRESFGVVQIEAMACGVPVVATRNGGSEEIITSEDYGLLCEPGNPDDLAKKILIALEKEWDRERIRKYAEQFSWDVIARKILQIYEFLLTK